MSVFKIIIIAVAVLFIVGYIVKSIIALIKYNKTGTKKGEENNVK